MVETESSAMKQSDCNGVLRSPLAPVIECTNLPPSAQWVGDTPVDDNPCVSVDLRVVSRAVVDGAECRRPSAGPVVQAVA
jgi:hypothetical protein